MADAISSDSYQSLEDYYSAYSTQQALEEAEANTSSSDLSSDAFMTLLLAQIQYQDPLDPQDSTEQMSQLADLSSLEALESIDASLAAQTESDDYNIFLQEELVLSLQSLTEQIDTLITNQTEQIEATNEMVNAAKAVEAYS